MKIAFYHNEKDEITTYTYKLLESLAIRYGHNVVNLPDAEIIGYTMTSHYDMPTLRKIRKIFPDKKIIVGGHASNSPAPLLAYADYVNLGQGFQIFKENKKIEDLNDKTYIVTNDKLEGEYSHYIDWAKIPIIRISKNSYSYLESVGCSHKCKFCLTSWMNKHQVNPNQKTLSYLSEKYSKQQLYFIGNNYESLSCNLKVSDVTVKGYNTQYPKYRGISLIRVGLESVTEKTRKSLGKNISDEDVRRFFAITKAENKRSNIFMIAGLNTQDEWEYFTEILPYDSLVAKPAIGIVINYIDPSFGTPLERYDLRKIIPVNIPRIKRLWKLHNSRIKIFHEASLSWKNSTIDSIIQRSYGIDKIEKLLKLKNETFSDFQEFIDRLYSEGFEKEVQGNYEYPFQLTNWHNNKWKPYL